MSDFYKELNYFIQFCFEHGGTLRNHKKFGEMSQKLLSLSLLSRCPTSDPINPYVVSINKAPELFVSLAPEAPYWIKDTEEQNSTVTIVHLVYRYEKQISEMEHVYKYAGVRISR